ncbi:HAD-like domain [Pseudocohnilembus persalinus]|uniref:HAD-like domain n=1 Tax=Pseudocohnilembus persalinus TaxID=266149 RepID=A0A0V0QNJ1_PSEPJ|nr:HAD-like domain [Pseudocohnilembus persalinus]|eukprot:KRX03509.1 HAD-like domain [Pseudocohnilembus persalinus]
MKYTQSQKQKLEAVFVLPSRLQKYSSTKSGNFSHNYQSHSKLQPNYQPEKILSPNSNSLTHLKNKKQKSDEQKYQSTQVNLLNQRKKSPYKEISQVNNIPQSQQLQSYKNQSQTEELQQVKIAQNNQSQENQKNVFCTQKNEDKKLRNQNISINNSYINNESIILGKNSQKQKRTSLKQKPNSNQSNNIPKQDEKYQKDVLLTIQTQKNEIFLNSQNDSFELKEIIQEPIKWQKENVESNNYNSSAYIQNLNADQIKLNRLNTNQYDNINLNKISQQIHENKSEKYDIASKPTSFQDQANQLTNLSIKKRNSNFITDRFTQLSFKNKSSDNSFNNSKLDQNDFQDFQSQNKSLDFSNILNRQIIQLKNQLSQLDKIHRPLALQNNKQSIQSNSQKNTYREIKSAEKTFKNQFFLQDPVITNYQQNNLRQQTQSGEQNQEFEQNVSLICEKSNQIFQNQRQNKNQNNDYKNSSTYQQNEVEKQFINIQKQQISKNIQSQTSDQNSLQDNVELTNLNSSFVNQINQKPNFFKGSNNSIQSKENIQKIQSLSVDQNKNNVLDNILHQNYLIDIKQKTQKTDQNSKNTNEKINSNNNISKNQQSKIQIQNPKSNNYNTKNIQAQQQQFNNSQDYTEKTTIIINSIHQLKQNNNYKQKNAQQGENSVFSDNIDEDETTLQLNNSSSFKNSLNDHTSSNQYQNQNYDQIIVENESDQNNNPSLMHKQQFKKQLTEHQSNQCLEENEDDIKSNGKHQIIHSPFVFFINKNIFQICKQYNFQIIDILDTEPEIGSGFVSKYPKVKQIMQKISDHQIKPMVQFNKNEMKIIKSIKNYEQLLKNYVFETSYSIHEFLGTNHKQTEQSYKKYRNALNNIYIVPDIKPLQPESKVKYTLVLDMDETLIHCLGTKEKKNDKFQISELVIIRPYVHQFLEILSKYYEIIIFTAAIQHYADSVIDLILDPEQKFISHRFYREHCKIYESKKEGKLRVKDITQLNRDMDKILIMDDKEENLLFQQDNGILVSAWEGDSEDSLLYQLTGFLKSIVEQSGDVRKAIQQLKLNSMKQQN